MRELIFKNLVAPSSRKRDISIEEVVERDGLVSCTKKRSMYFVRSVHHLKSRSALHTWMERKKKSGALDKKFFHILRQYSARDKVDKLICKMRGTFYIVSNQDVYNIVFVHAVRISVSKRGK